jgi:dienelactone hydrolase
MRLASLVKIFVTLLLSASVQIPEAIAQTAPPQLSIYAAKPGVELTRISPSGDHIVVIGTAGNERKLMVRDRDNKLVLVLSLYKTIIRNVDWVGDKMLLVTRKDPALVAGVKYDIETMYALPIDGSPAWEVFEKTDGVLAGDEPLYAVSERDGRFYAYVGAPDYNLNGMRRPGGTILRPSLFEIDLQTRKVRRVASRKSNLDDFRDWLVGSDGEIKATLEFEWDSKNWTIYNSDRKAVASGKAASNTLGLLCFGQTQDTIFYATNDVDPKIGVTVYELSLLSGTQTKLKMDTAGRAFKCDGQRRFVGVRRDDGMDIDPHYAPDLYKIMEALRKTMPDRILRAQFWNRAGDNILVWSEGGRDPGTLWFVDVRNRAEPVMRPVATDYPLRSEQVGETRLVPYKAADGAALTAVLTLPPDRPAKNLPVVVLPRDWLVDRTVASFQWWAQAFAARGYAVVQPNFRGSRGSGTAPSVAGTGELGGKMQSDLFDVVTQLAAQGIVDPSRTCIMGNGYGGYAAMRAATSQPGKVRCAVAVGGVSDLDAFMDEDPMMSGDQRDVRDDFAAGLKQRENGAVDRHGMTQLSPVKGAKQAVAPILLIHTKQDSVVPVRQSEMMAAALRKAGKPVTLLTLDGDDHWLRDTDNRLGMLGMAVAFVEKYNPADKP